MADQLQTTIFEELETWPCCRHCPPPGVQTPHHPTERDQHHAPCGSWCNQAPPPAA